jgi:hypothetical protein
MSRKERDAFVAGAEWSDTDGNWTFAGDEIAEADRRYPDQPAAPSGDVTLREALVWAMDRLRPYSHPAECSPTKCVCGYYKAKRALARPAAAETTGLLSTLERLKQNFLDCSRQHEDALVVQQYAAQKLDAKSVSHGFKRAAEKIDTLLASNTGEAAKQLLGALYMVKLMKAASHALRGNSDPTIAKTVADQIDAALAEPLEGGKT